MTFEALHRVMLMVGGAYNAGKLGTDRQLYEDIQRVIVWMDEHIAQADERL